MNKPRADYTELLELYRLGFGPSEIIERLGLTITKRQIQRIAAKAGISGAGQKKRGGRIDVELEPMFKEIVLQLMTEYRGLDPYTCMQCKRPQVKRCDIHHTKYDGATLYDLEFVCRRCNTSPRNVGLL